MKRIIYALGVMLLFSLLLNVKYELKTNQFEKKIHKIIYGKKVLTEEVQYSFYAILDRAWMVKLSYEIKYSSRYSILWRFSYQWK